MISFTAVVAIGAVLVVCVEGHGYLHSPPNRGSLWRFGHNTPVNYQDNEQFCGGWAVQWEQNDGKCGECGDDYALPRPRSQENGGIFGKGIISAVYKKGAVITASAEITANHMGSFEFALCPLSNSSELETQECFSKHPLSLADGSGTKYYLPSPEVGRYSVKLKLPDELTCSQCVLQWTWTTGNSWGICENGEGAIGCGAQETFRTCSDITIQ
ncbi:uncharacterized protein [Anabrus simplex]|uniref:uncharacterized protein n=1 Tax=Anabrus simplex TaxID=316456 RepID=UPI0035A3842A